VARRDEESFALIFRMTELPFVTVVMPVRNESTFIRRSLSAVLAQDYPEQSMEILIVDGMSTDDTREIVLELAEQHSNLRLIDNPKGIAPTALNLGLAAARGEIIVRVDGHCEVASDYVRQCVEHLHHDGVDAVGGPIETVGETLTAQMIAVAMSSRFGVGGSSFRTLKDRAMLVDTVAFPGFTRAAIEKAGPFDEELVRNQDDEYSYRLRKLGGRILLSPKIRSRYYSRSSLRSLWRQYFQYGYWKVRVMQKHWQQMRAYQFAPAVFVSLLALSLVLSPFSGVARLVFLTAALTYAFANLTVSLRTITNWRGLPTLAASFAILHSAYGFGFLYGLGYFWNSWGNRQNRPISLPGPSPKQV
jgi:cellulose synthase/poly-beta-1,6-N-acetylglucosamine synthase-like glycosyltransferase